MSLSTERRRLTRVFKAALLAAGSPVVVACSTSGPGAEADAAPPATDATLTGDTAAPVLPDGSSSADDADDDASDAGAVDAAPPPPPPEAGPDAGCACIQSYEVDAGPDADASDFCAFVYTCLPGTGLQTSGCQVLAEESDGGLVPIPQMTCWVPEGAGCDHGALAPGDGGPLTIVCSPCPSGGGRRPAGLCRPRAARGRTALGAYFASMAFEEDAAVAAFERMRGELAALGAPADLVAAAARAARDEARHVRAMASLARSRRRDGVVARARVRRLPPRSPAAIALENAAEGCVRETYGALVARWQSLHAEELELRRAFTRIAADEARHAALSWALAEWLEPRLDPAARRRVLRARVRALETLRRAAAVEPPSEVARAAGVPRARQARALLDAMSRGLPLA